MRQFLIRNWFLCLLVLVLAVGFAPHEGLRTIPKVIPETWVVATVLFLMTLPLDWSSMWSALRRPKAVLLAVAINFGLLPLVAWPLSTILYPDLGLGLKIVASIPTTLASCAVLTRRAGGNDAVAVLVTVITNLLCFIVTPAWLALTGGAVVGAVQIDPAKMATKLGLLVVTPMLVAQLLRLIRPLGRFATRHKTPLGVLAQMGLLTMVLIGAITAGESLADNQTDIGAVNWLIMLACVCGLHLSILASGHGFGHLLGLAREDRIAVGFSGSQKTLMVGLHIALSPPYSSGLAVLPLVAYHVCQLLLDTLVANRLRDRAPTVTSIPIPASEPEVARRLRLRDQPN